jgi:hypothetical protein
MNAWYYAVILNNWILLTKALGLRCGQNLKTSANVLNFTAKNGSVGSEKTEMNFHMCNGTLQSLQPYKIYFSKKAIQKPCVLKSFLVNEFSGIVALIHLSLPKICNSSPHGLGEGKVIRSLYCTLTKGCKYMSRFRHVIYTSSRHLPRKV